MALTAIEAEEALAEFLASYPSAAALTYSAGRREGDTFGLAETETQIKGMYYSARHPGERSAVRVALDHANSKADLIETLRHEVLGHWAIDTFTPAQKAAILYGLVLARNQPGLRTFWDSVDHDYAKLNMSHMGRAEEVWARIAETIEPGSRNDLKSASESFVATCVDRSRLMTLRDVLNIVDAVAGQIREGKVKQQTFRTGGVEGNRFSLGTGPRGFREEVAAELIEALKSGTAPWQRPWSPAGVGASLPTNPTTGIRYRGVNALHLMMQNRGDSRWMTYKQAMSIGAQVRKGEKGTRIEYWQFEDEHARIGPDGRQVMRDDGRPVMERTKLERPRVFNAYVFNAEQIDGLPAPEMPPYGWADHEKAEAILRGSGARIVHLGQDGAYYSPSIDEIRLPGRDQFSKANDYYAVALHELGHWTGHGSRLNRDLSHPFGSEGYAREELRAEIASMIMGRELGIGQDPRRHASYVASWIKVLQEDPSEIFRAAAAAEKIFEYVLGFSQVQTTEQVSTSAEVTVKEGAMEERVYVEVPEGYEAEATALGATYDAVDKLWWFDGKAIPSVVYDRWAVKVGNDGNGEPVFQKLPRLDVDEGVRNEPGPREPIYISVPYEQKDIAQALGARWDRAASSWYIPDGVNEGLFSQWPRRGTNYPRSAQEEFGEVLKGMGFELAEVPVMDGRYHRAATIGDKGDATSGSYVGYLDGHPAGYAKNHRTGEEIRWKSTSRRLNDDGRGVFLADTFKSQARRDKERDEKYERGAARLQARIAQLKGDKAAETPYVRAKGIRVAGPLLTDENAQTLYIPGFDIDGKMWTVQRVTADGAKEFEAGCRKTGCFFPLGSREEFERAPVIIIVEGFSTAATVREAVGFATVAAFDAGNLMSVAKAFRSRFPDKPILIGGDEDRYLISIVGTNVGREKAEAAAAAVGGKAVFPIFAASENEYPAELEKVTPEKYKAHLIAEKALGGTKELSETERADLQGRMLSPEQLDALDRMKRHTDWNDLAHHGRGGMAAVQRQLTAALKPVVALASVSNQVEKTLDLKPRQSESIPEMSIASRGQTRRL